MSQRKTSQRYWHFEEVLSETPSFAPLRIGPMSIFCLQLYADLIWKHERGVGPPPIVKARRKNDESLYVSPKRAGDPPELRLCPSDRTLWGLLHEIAHALGPQDKLDHGSSFRRRCIRLYKFYGGWSGEVDFDKKERKT